MSEKIVLSQTKFTFKFPCRQNFSIPENIVYYLTKNPTSALGWKKLIQTCKYFFSKNQIIVADSLFSYKRVDVRNYIPGTKYDSIKEYKNVDMESNKFKLWITKDITLIEEINNIYSWHLIIQKIYSFGNEIKFEFIGGTLLYTDLCMLPSLGNIEKFSLKTCVTYFDGSKVGFDKIFELFPLIKQISFTSNNALLSTEVINRMNKLPCFEKLKYFVYFVLNHELNLEAFSIFIKKNKQAKFQLNFWNSSEDYKNQVKSFINKMVKECYMVSTNVSEN